jgi:4-hydroxy-tetrahydrodipicolinate synthase
MEKLLFEGVCTALVTPFANGTIDYYMLQKLLEHQIEAEIPAVVLAGTTGESPVLSDVEKQQLFKAAVRMAAGRCKIIAGTGSNNTEHCVRLSQIAEDCGADGLLIVSPYYNKTSADGLLQHYGSVARKTTLPIIVYNVPSRTGMDIPVGCYKDLSRIESVVGVKEASGSIQKVAQIKAQCSADFNVWTGNDDLIVPVMALGGKGVISVIANALPRETLAITTAALQGDYLTAASKQLQLLPVIDMLFQEVNPMPIKHVMSLLGYDCGECRLPLTKPSLTLQEKLKEYFVQ